MQGNYFLIFTSIFILDFVIDFQMVKYFFVIFYLCVVIVFEVGDLATGNNAAATNQIDCFPAHALFLSICAKYCCLE